MAGRAVFEARPKGVRVGEVGVDGVGHRVERPHVRRELVDDVEVGVELVVHDLAEDTLVLRAQILVGLVIGYSSCVLEVLVDLVHQLDDLFFVTLVFAAILSVKVTYEADR